MVPDLSCSAKGGDANFGLIRTVLIVHVVPLLVGNKLMLGRSLGFQLPNPFLCPMLRVCVAPSAQAHLLSRSAGRLLEANTSIVFDAQIQAWLLLTPLQKV